VAIITLLAGLGLSVLPPVTSPARASVTTELIQLTTADGLSTTAVLYRPTTGSPRGGVVLVHGYGSNFYSGPVGFLGPALGRHGFAAIAANMRDHDRGPKTNRFEDNRWDEQAAVDELARRGIAPVALIAVSLGTNRALYYLAATQDPRVRAIGLLAAPGNAQEWNVRTLGPDRAARALEDARRLQAAGRGKELMVVDLGPLGQALYSADHLVSLRGPDTRSDPYRNIAELTVPVLVVHAASDRLVDPAVAPRLRAAATRAPRVSLVEIGGADHGFTRHASEVTEVIEGWLRQVLAP
jgi:pimeloyl-ACP methyl ester carboxylesterase